VVEVEAEEPESPGFSGIPDTIFAGFPVQKKTEGPETQSVLLKKNQKSIRPWHGKVLQRLTL
jgi:hypothetical protein